MKRVYCLITMAIFRIAACFLFFSITIGFSLYSAKATVNWAMPLNGLTKSSGYSGFIPNRVISESSNAAAHLSQDYVSSTGQWDVMAIYSGKVIEVRNSLSDGAGRYVIIQHTIGSATVYSEYQHLQSISVSNGQSISAGQVIGVGGRSGTTEDQYGRHLHIAIYTGVQDAWAPRLTQYAQNTVYDGPIEHAGTTYYNPDRVLHGLSIIPGTDTDPASNLRFKDVTYPKTFKIDTTYGWSLGSGTLESNYTLTSIRSEILNSSGGSVSDSGVKSISGYSYSIKSLDDYSGTNNGVRFSWISSEGDYTWRLTATDSGGRTLVMDMPFTAVNSGSTSTATMSKEYNESIAVTGVAVDPDKVTLRENQTTTLTATVSPSDATNQAVSWSSNNSGVARVETINARQATVRAVTGGTAVITCTTSDGGKTATCTVTVITSVTGLTLSPTSLQLNVGATSTLTATISPSNASNKNVTWSSDNTAVATVSGGVVRAVGVGRATITCSSKDNNDIKATCAVVVQAEGTSDFILPSALKEIGKEAFAGINARRVVVSEGVKTIGQRAFANCVKLEQITIPASTTAIATDAFANAPSGFTIHGMLNSYAQTFASENGIRFVADDACTITFNANGGASGETTRRIKKGAAIGALPTPTRTYYYFRGWYTQQSDGSEVTSSTAFTQDQTLYARWESKGFGNWSEWSTTPVAGSDNREVQSEVRSVQTGTKTIYNYNRFLYWRPETGYYQASYSSNWATNNGYSGSWQYLSTETRLPVDHTTDGQNVYLGEVRDGNKWWYNESTTTEPVYGNVTYYRYRDRIQ